MRENKAKHVLRTGGAVLAITLNFVHAGLAEYLGRLGYHAIVLDGEHGGVDDTAVEEFVRACDAARATSMLRLPFNDALMQRYLAIGIQGFHVPNVRSAAEARAVVDAVKFRPVGKRGLGTFRSADYGLALKGGWPAYAQKSNAETLIEIIVEEPEGIAALPEIVKVAEVDVVGVGPSDLADSMGLQGRPDDPRVVAELEKANAIIIASGKTLFATMKNVEDAKKAYRLGARFMLTSVARVIADGVGDIASIGEGAPGAGNRAT